MSNIAELSESKRALLEKYLRGDLPQATKAANLISRRIHDGPIPLSFGQQQLWLLDQLIPSNPIYTECATIHLPGPLDIAALEQSLNKIIRRHEVWRTSFPIVDRQPIQMIHSPSTLTLPVVDLRYLPESEREAEAVRLVKEDARILFDLAQGPLLRAKLMRLGDAEHRLFLTLHQIIFDGVSLFWVFLPELRTLYEAFSCGWPSPLPDLPIQYADFAVWQREWFQGDMLADHLAYWKKQLANAPATLELPTDRPRPSASTYRGLMRPFALSKCLTEALKALSRQEGVTLFMVLLAAFNTLLYRYTNQDDLLIGTLTGGRKRAEVQGLMGYFPNTLVLHTNLSGNPSFRELLIRVREMVLEALVHEEVPFEYLVKELQPERNLGQNPLFQVMLTLEPSEPILQSGWTLTHMDIETDTAKFDLHLELDDRPEGLIGRFIYSTDLFDAATIVRMLGHWQHLLESIVADPTQNIDDLPLLSEAEWQQQVVQWNATQTDFPQDQCFHQLFEAQVQRTPEAVAVVDNQEQLTYQELNQRANYLARKLQALGIGPETIVALLAERSTAFLTAVLAVFKAGGAYLPLDSHHPPSRIRHILEHSGSRLVLASKGFAPLLSQALSEWQIETAPQVVYLEDVAFSKAIDAGNLPPRATPDNLAYVIYTSGSTGLPKGVMIEQRGMINHLYAKVNALQLTATDRVAQTASQCFDISVWQFLAALLVGGQVRIFNNDISHTSMQLLAQVEQQKISILETVPSLLRMMLESIEGGRNDYPRLEELRWLIPTGEALPPEFCHRWLRVYPQIPLLNAYGPTECSDDVTHFPIFQPLAETQVHTPIGRPIQNMQLYILDRKLRPLPVGVNGELYVGGVGVGRGYLNDVQRTAEAFVADPFSNEPGTRLYKTGDLARYLPDGNIEFLGRIDHQVKIRGYRIELGEIEALLRQHSSVQDVVVIVREDIPGNKSLVAYVVASSDVTSNDLSHYLKEKLPDYMVPAAFVLLESLPLTPNGKVDRRALPAPEYGRFEQSENFVSPVLPVHQQLIEIWEELLEARPIGIRDNFFELGGHSLLAIRLVDRIEQAWGKKIPPTTLLAGATIEQLANFLVRPEEANAAPEAVQAANSKRSSSESRPLLSSIKTLWGRSRSSGRVKNSNM